MSLPKLSRTGVLDLLVEVGFDFVPPPKPPLPFSSSKSSSPSSWYSELGLEGEDGEEPTIPNSLRNKS